MSGGMSDRSYPTQPNRHLKSRRYAHAISNKFSKIKLWNERKDPVRFSSVGSVPPRIVASLTHLEKGESSQHAEIMRKISAQQNVHSVEPKSDQAHSEQQDPISPSSEQSSDAETDATTTVRDVTPTQTETLGTTAPADAAAVQQDTSLETSPGETTTKVAADSKSGKPFSSFTKKQKWGIVVMSSVAGLFSPISSVILAPSLPVLVEQFQRSSEDINLTMTLYL